MAPLRTATTTTPLQEHEDGSKTYSSQIDGEWTVGSAAFGGYLLGVILDATQHFQASSSLTDPIYLSAQFLRAVTTGPCTVTVKAVRTGRTTTNLEARLIQKDALMLTAQIIYGDLTLSSAPSAPSFPASLKPICPIRTHPSQCGTPQPRHWAQNFYTRYTRTNDPHLLAGNVERAKEEGAMHGMWVKLHETGDEGISPLEISAFADLGEMNWKLVPHEQRGPAHWWYPTLSMSIEFKHRLPLKGEYASRTAGIFAWKRHLDGGRWNDSFEIWTAPCELGDTVQEDDGWREKMVCLAVGSQTALMVSPETNSRYGQGGKEEARQKSKL